MRLNTGQKGRDCIIRIIAKRQKNDLLLQVSDNGKGIDLSKHKNQILGLYKRFHHEVEGKGVGLHITKKQIESLEGTISVESEVNAGTTFTIVLPNSISEASEPE